MRRYAALLALACLPGLAQTTFEVASVKPNHSGDNHSHTHTSNDRFTSENVSLKGYIALAYDVRDDQISGPGWLSSERFDVAAKAPAVINRDTLMPMLQALLADRFKLALHRETKEERVYALVTAKDGAKLKPVAPTGDSGTDVTGGSMTATAISMPQLARALTRSVKMTVVDQTGLTGVFSFKLEWDPSTNAPSPDAPSDSQGLSIFTALQQQLGLRLELRKLPVDILIIDHIERTPTEN